jgi:signal transduction histidine kinase
MQYAEPDQIKKQIIQQALDPGLNPQTLLSEIARQLGTMTRVNVCAIFAGVNSADILQIGLWRDRKSCLSSLEESLQLRAHPVIDKIIDPEFLAIADLKQKKQKNQAFELGEALGVKALVKLPAVFQKNINGTLVFARSKPHDWTDSEIAFFKAVSESIALAISISQIQQQAQSANRYRTLLNDLSQAIGQSAKLDSIFKLALKDTATALMVDRGLILTLKYKNPLFKRSSDRELPQGKADVVCQWSLESEASQAENQASFRLSESLFLCEALNHAPLPLAIANRVDFPELNITNPSVIGNPNATSALLFVPLMGSSSSESKTHVVLGFLVLEQKQPRFWQTEELELVSWVCTQLSTALLHNQSLSRVQSLVDERTAQLKWSLDVQAKLSEKMRQQIEELQLLNKLKDDFLSSMSHELNTPLTTMKMAIEMLRKTGSDPDRQQKYLNILEQEWNREYNLIKDLLTLQKLESDKLKVQPQEVNLNQLISQLASSFAEKWHADKGLSLTVEWEPIDTSPDSALMLYTDLDSLEHILNELLLNAGKYSDPDTTVVLRVSHQVKLEGNTIIISVTNCGAGIAPEEQKYIFDKFRRGKGVTDRAVPGTGLGLALVKSLVEHLNGTIEFSSELSQNPPAFMTSFTIVLPQLQK